MTDGQEIKGNDEILELIETRRRAGFSPVTIWLPAERWLDIRALERRWLLECGRDMPGWNEEPGIDGLECAGVPQEPLGEVEMLRHNISVAEETLKRVRPSSRYGILEDPCEECGGSGYLLYSSIGGLISKSSPKYGPCDRCWGSGDAKRPWLAQRAPGASEL